MKKYRKKPVVIEAVCWNGGNTVLVTQWAQGDVDLPDRWIMKTDRDGSPCALIIPTLEGDHEARVGDWIIKGVAGEFYPCKPEIFAATYEAVE